MHDGDSPGIVDRVHIMVNISDDTKLVRRRGEVTGVVRRRRWRDEEKGRIVAEAIAPGAVISDVARLRHRAAAWPGLHLGPGLRRRGSSVETRLVNGQCSPRCRVAAPPLRLLPFHSLAI